MKKLTITISIFYSVIFTAETLAACKRSGPEIMKEQNTKHSANYEFENQQIVILDQKSKNKETRTIKRYMVKVADNNKKSLLYFDSPSSIKGAGLLSWKLPNEENQWLYLPELKKLQRIASGSRSNYFMGTDFTYADLEGENLDKNNYECLKEGNKCRNGSSICYVIQATPINPTEARNTGYSKRMLLVDQNDLTTQKIIYYNLKGKSFKTAEYTEWVTVNNLLRPNLAVMNRHEVQKTFIKVNTRELNKKIDDLYFQKRYLEKEMHIK